MYAFYCLHKFHWNPAFFVNLPLKEKIVVKVFVDERIKEEKKQQSQMKKSGQSSKHIPSKRR